MLGRDRRATNLGIKLSKVTVEHGERLVHDRRDRSQRVLLRDPAFQVNVAKERPRLLTEPRIEPLRHLSRRRNHAKLPMEKTFFIALLIGRPAA